MKKYNCTVLLLVICFLLSGCGHSGNIIDDVRYYQTVIQTPDSIICIKAHNSASIVDLNTEIENAIRGANNLSYYDAVYCVFDGKIYFEHGNILYSVDQDGTKLKKVWKKGTDKSNELSVKASYGSKILCSLIYKSSDLGIYDGEYIIYDTDSKKTVSINGQNPENAFSYLITSSKDGKVYMISRSGSDYHLVCVDLTNNEVDGLGELNVPVGSIYPEWTGCIAGHKLYFTDRGCDSGMIYCLDVNGAGKIQELSAEKILADVDPRFGNRIFVTQMDSYKDTVYFLLNEFKDRDYESALYSWNPDDDTITFLNDCNHMHYVQDILVAGDSYYIYSAEELITVSCK